MPKPTSPHVFPAPVPFPTRAPCLRWLCTFGPPPSTRPAAYRGRARRLVPRICAAPPLARCVFAQHPTPLPVDAVHHVAGDMHPPAPAALLLLPVQPFCAVAMRPAARAGAHVRLCVRHPIVYSRLCMVRVVPGRVTLSVCFSSTGASALRSTRAPACGPGLGASAACCQRVARPAARTSGPGGRCSRRTHRSTGARAAGSGTRESQPALLPALCQDRTSGCSGSGSRPARQPQEQCLQVVWPWAADVQLGASGHAAPSSQGQAPTKAQQCGARRRAGGAAGRWHAHTSSATCTAAGAAAGARLSSWALQAALALADAARNCTGHAAACRGHTDMRRVGQWGAGTRSDAHKERGGGNSACAARRGGCVQTSAAGWRGGNGVGGPLARQLQRGGRRCSRLLTCRRCQRSAPSAPTCPPRPARWPLRC